MQRSPTAVEIGSASLLKPGGSATVGVYHMVHLTVQGRDCKVEVTEIAEGSPALIGQIPLEIMDWVIDMKGQKLIGNPLHGGEWMYDV